MNSAFLIRPEHLNHKGFLFGGALLARIDELAYMTAMTSYPGHNFVTKVITDVNFMAPGRLGDIMVLEGRITKKGTSSVHVDVHARIAPCTSDLAAEERTTFEGTVVLVNVGPDGKSAPICEPSVTSPHSQSPH